MISEKIVDEIFQCIFDYVVIIHDDCKNIKQDLIEKGILEKPKTNLEKIKEIIRDMQHNTIEERLKIIKLLDIEIEKERKNSQWHKQNRKFILLVNSK